MSVGTDPYASDGDWGFFDGDLSPGSTPGLRSRSGSTVSLSAMAGVSGKRAATPPLQRARGLGSAPHVDEVHGARWPELRKAALLLGVGDGVAANVGAGCGSGPFSHTMREEVPSRPRSRSRSNSLTSLFNPHAARKLSNDNPADGSGAATWRHKSEPSGRYDMEKPPQVCLTVGTSAAARVLIPASLLLRRRQEQQQAQLAGRPTEPVIPHGLYCYRADRHRLLLGGALTDGGSTYQWISGLLLGGTTDEAPAAMTFGSAPQRCAGSDASDSDADADAPPDYASDHEGGEEVARHRRRLRRAESRREKAFEPKQALLLRQAAALHPRGVREEQCGGASSGYDGHPMLFGGGESDDSDDDDAVDDAALSIGCAPLTVLPFLQVRGSPAPSFQASARHFNAHSFSLHALVSRFRRFCLPLG